MKLLQSNPTRENVKQVTRMQTFVKKQVEQRMQGHEPHFTRMVTIMQIIIMVAMMFSPEGKLAPWGMGVVEKEKTVEVFKGTATQPLQIPENPYYGPNVETLVAWGSKWSPCMRRDATMLGFREDLETAQASFGCCFDVSSGNCGMMSESDCDSYGSTFLGLGVSCATSTPPCQQTILHPCCYGIFGQCALLTKDHCDAVDGRYDDSKELCDGEECLFKVCGMTYNYHEENLFGYEHPNQFYRFATATFLHVGAIHLIMNCLGQYVLVSQVEFVAGFWRTAIMYVGSGVGGFMISALFSASLLSNGASAAIYGMLGVETVDLFQSWQLVEDKAMQLVGLIVKLILFLGIGTLPYIDNFAHVGGFIAGIVLGLMFLPYIVFGSFDEFRKRLFQFLAAFLLCVLFFGLLYKFYEDGEIICDECEYINCVPYTSSICEIGRAHV